MQVQGFFDWLGQAVGTVIRVIVELLAGFFELIGNAGQHFLSGMARALGMESSLLGMIALLIGLLFLATAVHAFIRRRFVAGIVWLLLALWLLSLIIH